MFKNHEGFDRFKKNKKIKNLKEKKNHSENIQLRLSLTNPSFHSNVS